MKKGGELNQKRLPYVEAINGYIQKKRLPFHMPGHKQGKGASSIIKKMLGKKAFTFDLTEVEGSDYLNAPKGVIAEAETLAAQAFGAKRTFFLINGSTVGNQAAIMSVVKEHEKILVARNSHQSTSAGLILSGAYPVYVQPTIHSSSGFYPVTSVDAVSKLLNKESQIKAVHITSPTHIGFMSDIESIRRVTNTKKIPLIVDEAHGSHFQFHPELPTSAIAQNADIVVQSTHKTIGSFTQTSMLHLVNSKHVKEEEIQNILRLLQSSSPNTLFVMSLDAARHQMANDGKKLLTRALELARYLRESINQIEGLFCYGNEIVGKEDIVSLDETKIFINVSKTGHTGHELEKILGRKYGIEIEMSDTNHILCFITIGDTQYSINRLLKSLKDIASHPKKSRNQEKENIFLTMPGIPKLVLTPREAFLASKKRVSLSSSIGKISGEFIVSFPPDIPIVIPGEIISKEILDYVKYLKRGDTMLVGPKDISLESIEIIEK